MYPNTEHLEGNTEADQFLPPQLGQQSLPGYASRQPPALYSYHNAASPPAEGTDAAPPFTVAHVGGEWPEEGYPSKEKKSGKASERVVMQMANGYPAAVMPPQATQQNNGAPFSAPGPGFQVWLVPSGGRGGHFPSGCRNCNYSGPLLVHREAGACTWLSSALLCIMGAWICAPLPFCCSLTKDQVLRCPSCGLELCRQLP